MSYTLYAALLSSQLAPPTNTVLPAITGTAQVGLSLSVSNGTWSNSPTGFTYQWTSAGTNVPGATAATYLLQGSDNGNTVTCIVTATNAGGSSTASATGVAVGPAVFSLVGTAGAVVTGASGGAVTPAYGASQTRATNNLLVCRVVGLNHSTTPTTPSGWSVGPQLGVGTPTFGSATIFYKIAAGGDAAPLIAALATEIWVAQVSEYQGNAHASPLDQQITASGAASPLTGTLPSADTTAGELVVTAGLIEPTSAVAVTSSTAFNNGATAVTQSNDATVTQSHYSFATGITTGNAGADTATLTTTGTVHLILAVASFKLAS